MISLVLGLASVVMGLAVVVVVGGAIGGAVARVSELVLGRQVKPADASQRPTTAHVHSRFEPMDLDPYLVKWPSENPRPARKLPVLEWPSKSWDDPHFGKFNASHAGASAKPDTPKPASRERPPRRAQTKKSRAKRQVKRTQRAPAPPQAGSPPTPLEVSRWVEQSGLAGAVGQIRKRTGWEFREAAQYLSQAMLQVHK